MAASIHLDLGNGPLVVLLHGVGLGPASFRSLAEHLAAAHRVVVVERPAGGSVEAQADAVAHLVRSVGPPAALVGVSGGATVALALAVRQGDVCRSYVLHEPLVGALAPRLHRRFQAAAARAATGPEAALEVVRSVMGEATWADLSPTDRADAIDDGDRWSREVPAFAAFDPAPRDLCGLTGRPVLVTVGDRSGPDRREAAAVLGDLAGAEVAVVPGAGNAPHLDAPAAFAELVGAWLPAPVGGRP